MSKVILVLSETPEKCTDCPACSGHGVATLCRAEGKYMNACISGRPSWCHLRPMPEMKPEPQSKGLATDTWDRFYALGWNAAIKAIDGSGEDDQK